ncbi:MAG: ATP-grasp domain-containing protein [Planctomycetes bacterium]|nr:ATP-grasp domain-containing protein [Planctomycetota bacterium]
MLARVVHRRTLEYPAAGGPSARCETARWPDLEEAAIALLREAGWVGPAQVEFRRDARDGSFRLLEVNPRLWGSLPLARLAGVNLVGMWYRMGLGERVAPAPPAPAGIRLRFAAMEWASALGQGTWRARLGAVARAAAATLGASIRDGIESAADPGPGTCYRAEILRRASARCLSWSGGVRKAVG